MDNTIAKVSRLILIIIGSVCLLGCTDYGTMPKSVKFPKEGGTRNLYCEGGAYNIKIEGFPSLDSDWDDKGECTLEADWVTLTIKNYGTDWEIDVSPNTTGKSRSVYVHYATVPNQFPDLKITQK